VKEFGCCYCALYVRKDVFEGKTPIAPIPERRPLKKQTRAYGGTVEVSTEKSTETTATVAKEPSKIQMKMWYCKQCGYVCFREDPPYICPICKAKKEMFAEITITIEMQG
jgi:predicted Zn-ribbon and HTH transcriptional regulator